MDRRIVIEPPIHQLWRHGGELCCRIVDNIVNEIVDMYNIIVDNLCS